MWLSTLEHWKFQALFSGSDNSERLHSALSPLPISVPVPVELWHLGRTWLLIFLLFWLPPSGVWNLLLFINCNWAYALWQCYKNWTYIQKMDIQTKHEKKEIATAGNWTRAVKPVAQRYRMSYPDPEAFLNSGIKNQTPRYSNPRSFGL
jgi:hypothetical protein